MSGFETIVPMVSAGMGMATSIGSAYQAQNAASAQTEAITRQNQLILQRQAQEDQNQRNLLEQAASTQRARMGAQGMDGNGGSADAILAGMAENTANSVAAGDTSALLKLRPTPSGDNLLSAAGGIGRSGLSVFSSFYDALG